MARRSIVSVAPDRFIAIQAGAWWCFWKQIITSQSRRTVKALELGFPVLKIRAAV